MVIGIKLCNINYKQMKHSPFSALKFRDFRLLWLGLLISRIGSEMQVVAVAWHIYLLTHSPFSLGLIGLARFLPVIFFALIGGIAADTINRKKVMLIAQIFMTIFSVILAATTYTGNISPILIYLLIGLGSAASALDTPARQSIVPLLVPKKYFLNAVSLNTTMWHTAVVLGPSIAGFIIAFSGVGSVYTINALSFLGVIAALTMIKTPTPSSILRHTPGVSLENIKEGIHFVFKNPIISSTMLLDFFATFFASATVLLPIFAKDIFAVGPTGIGFLYAAPSIGAIVASIIISSHSHIHSQGRLLFISVFIYGTATALFGLSRSLYLSLLFLTIAGAGDIVSTIIRNTIRQLITPDHLRGRMVATNMIFFMGGPQLGEFEAGILAHMFGAPTSVVIGGIGTMTATLIMAIFVPKLRKYQGDEVVI